MSKEKNLSLLAATLTLSTVAAGGLLLSSSSSATDASISANATVTVGAACTLASSVSSAHTITMLNDSLSTDIGTTTLTATCNDMNGYALYAVGYSGDIYGNNTMIGTNTGRTIATSTATSGDNSAWAMKVTSVGSTGPTITNNFNTYQEVPSVYTQVASQTGSTSTTSGSAVQTTYQVFVSGSEVADTFVGEVKYTLVNPSTSAAPES